MDFERDERKTLACCATLASDVTIEADIDEEPDAECLDTVGPMARDVAGGASALGLSKEMGALVAGLSIAAFPYSIHVTAKTLPLRDFFLTLFFMSLGLKITAPRWDMVGIIAALASPLHVRGQARGVRHDAFEQRVAQPREVLRLPVVAAALGDQSVALGREGELAIRAATTIDEAIDLASLDFVAVATMWWQLVDAAQQVL